METRTLLLVWKNSWSSYGTPSSSEITSDGIGSENAWTRSTGLGPASSRSMKPSTFSCTAGRMASTRLMVNAPLTIRRSLACSGSSMPTKLRSAVWWLSPSPPWSGTGLGKFGAAKSTLSRLSESSSFCSAWLVTSQGVLPSQVRTRNTGPNAVSARVSGEGSNGQPAARGSGNSGMPAGTARVSTGGVMLASPSRRVQR
jgi:hypothetical protein